MKDSVKEKQLKNHLKEFVMVTASMITKQGYTTLVSRLSTIDLPEDKVELVKQIVTESLNYDPDASTYDEYSKRYYETHKHNEQFKEVVSRTKKAYYERHKEDIREKNRLRMKARRAAEKAQREVEHVENIIHPMSVCV